MAPRLVSSYVVKFNEVDILNEGDTQAFVYTAFKCSPDAPTRVAEVYECFSWDGFQYLVMERVDLPTVETWINDATSEAEASTWPVRRLPTPSAGSLLSPLQSVPKLV